MKMNDKAQTNIRVHAVTSTGADKDINHSSNPPMTPILQLSIGSAILRLRYDAIEVRDSDKLMIDTELEKLDNPIQKVE